MIVSVTGATGLVGRFVVERLIAEQVQVRAWRRPASDLGGLPDSIDWIAGELGLPEAEAAVVAGADMLVHCALDHQPGRYRGGEGADAARHLRANVGGGLALLAAARAAGVGRCVVLSSRAVFGRAAPERIADEERPRPDTLYGAGKAALEAFVEAWGLGEGWPIAALRPTGVYGVVIPARKSKWLDLVSAALRGETVASRAGTEVHGRDVADAVWRLLTAPPDQVAGRMFNCSDMVVSTRDIVGIVQRITGVRGPLPDRAPEPGQVMTCAGLERLGLRFGGRPLLERTVEELVAAVAGGADHRFS